MNANLITHFLFSPPPETRDATAWHSALPRNVRKTLRIPNKSPKPCVAYTDLTETFRRDAYINDPYHNQNHEYTDNCYGMDEFGDIDDELDGLTITEPMDEAELWRFCTGYDVL